MIDTLAVGVDRIQRNFEPMQQVFEEVPPKNDKRPQAIRGASSSPWTKAAYRINLARSSLICSPQDGERLGRLCERCRRCGGRRSLARLLFLPQSAEGRAQEQHQDCGHATQRKNTQRFHLSSLHSGFPYFVFCTRNAQNFTGTSFLTSIMTPSVFLAKDRETKLSLTQIPWLQH